MRSVQSIEDLNIPLKHKAYITEYLQNISGIPFISRVILFGSCATETVTQYSDIDIFITVNRDVSEEEEFLLMADCLPAYKVGKTVPTDIVVQPEYIFNQHIDTTCMLQKQVNYYGVDLSGLIPKRA